MPNEVNEFAPDDRRPLPTLRDLFTIIFRAAVGHVGRVSPRPAGRACFRRFEPEI